MQSDTIDNGSKKGACTDRIDDTDITTTTETFENLQLTEPGGDDSEPLLDTAQQNQQHQDIHDPEDRLQSLYKTEICRNWEEQGTCRYGDKCQYAHGNHELRYIQRHPRYKTIHCRSFDSDGTCPYGRRCTFLHEPKSPPEHSSRGRRQHYTIPLTEQQQQHTPALLPSPAGPSTFVPGRPPLFVTSSRSRPQQADSSARLTPVEGNSTSVFQFSASTHFRSSSSSSTSNLLQYYHHHQSSQQHGTNQLDPSLYCDHYQHQYQQQQQLQLSPGHFTNSGSPCWSRELFTDTGGFSCAFGLSPPLLSPSNSNMPSSSSYFASPFSPSSSTVTASQFSPSSSTVTASSSPSSSTSTTSATDPKHHHFQ